MAQNQRKIESRAASFLGRNLCRKRGRLTRTAETAAACRRPRQGVALAIGYRDDRVVEGCVDVGDCVDHMLLDLLLFCFCHLKKDSLSV